MDGGDLSLLFPHPDPGTQTRGPPAVHTLHLARGWAHFRAPSPWALPAEGRWAVVPAGASGWWARSGPARGSGSLRSDIRTSVTACVEHTLCDPVNTQRDFFPDIVTMLFAAQVAAKQLLRAVARTVGAAWEAAE